MKDKKKLFEYRRVSKVNIYNLDGFEDYNYGYMPPSTGILKYFRLEKYDKGFLICLPNRKHPETLAPVKETPKLFATLQEASEWGRMMNVDTVSIK